VSSNSIRKPVRGLWDCFLDRAKWFMKSIKKGNLGGAPLRSRWMRTSGNENIEEEEWKKSWTKSGLELSTKI
jgi:hypothetical protein